MKIIFSFTLYGRDERYVAPMLSMDLAEIQKSFDTPLEFRVSCDVDVAPETIEKLRRHGCIVVERNYKLEGVGGMFARYQPIFENTQDPVLVRDMDSHIGMAEIVLIKEWLASECDFHIIRSHALHIYPIMGGLFGVRGDAKRIFHKAYTRNIDLTRSHKYNADQIFLCGKVYPQVYKNALIHSRRVVYRGEKFLKIEAGGNFPGETRLSDVKRLRERTQSLKNWNILKFPACLTPWAIKRPINRVISFFATRPWIG